MTCPVAGLPSGGLRKTGSGCLEGGWQGGSGIARWSASLLYKGGDEDAPTNILQARAHSTHMFVADFHFCFGVRVCGGGVQNGSGVPKP